MVISFFHNFGQTDIGTDIGMDVVVVQVLNGRMDDVAPIDFYFCTVVVSLS